MDCFTYQTRLPPYPVDWFTQIWLHVPLTPSPVTIAITCSTRQYIAHYCPLLALGEGNVHVFTPVKIDPHKDLKGGLLKQAQHNTHANWCPPQALGPEILPCLHENIPQLVVILLWLQCVYWYLEQRQWVGGRGGGGERRLEGGRGGVYMYSKYSTCTSTGTCTCVHTIKQNTRHDSG